MATNIVAYTDTSVGKGRADVYFLGNGGLGASDDGYWVNVSSLAEKTIHISGISGDTVKIFGSNAVTVPANTADEIQIGGDITADGLFEISFPYKWMKVSMTFSAGTVYAIMHARVKR